MRFARLSLLILFFAATGGASASSLSWLLEYCDESTNVFIWDKRTQPLVASKTHRSFAPELTSALSGSPGPVIVQQERYFTADACVPHACLMKGFFWLDMKTGAGLGAIFDGKYPENEGPLELDSMQIRGAIPEGARLSILRWLGERKAIPTSVEFTDASGARQSLPVASFRPPQGFVPPSSGPSFDCTRASTRMETMLCNEPELAAQDLKLSDDYQRMLVSLAELPARRQLAALQQKWLQQRDAVCGQGANPKECLARSYSEQEYVLQHWIPVPSSPQEVQSLTRSWFQSADMVYRGQRYFVAREPDANERKASFNTALAAHHLVAVDSCALLVGLPVDTAHGNHSYGGVCWQSSESARRAVMVCDDDMMGHFGFRVISKRKVSIEELAHFVADECYGG
ncbi:lysozyme inhibitor LprI family protein [Burkholderiaceae bacterium UC74_6]